MTFKNDSSQVILPAPVPLNHAIKPSTSVKCSIREQLPTQPRPQPPFHHYTVRLLSTAPTSPGPLPNSYRSSTPFTYPGTPPIVSSPFVVDPFAQFAPSQQIYPGQ